VAFHPPLRSKATVAVLITVRSGPLFYMLLGNGSIGSVLPVRADWSSACTAAIPNGLSFLR